MKKTKLTKKEIKDAIKLAQGEIIALAEALKLWSGFIKRMEELLKDKIIK